MYFEIFRVRTERYRKNFLKDLAKKNVFRPSAGRRLSAKIFKLKNYQNTKFSKHLNYPIQFILCIVIYKLGQLL